MPIRSLSSSPSTRRADLDWLRLGLFAGLIFYHEGLLYEPGRQAIGVLLLATHPWRMSLLFLISGAATRFVAERHSAAGLTFERSLRLLPPLVFAVLLLVPVQLYFSMVDFGGYTGGYLDFLRGYFVAPHKAVIPHQQTIYGHLWFVFYLWAYTLVLAAVLALRPGWVRSGERALGRLGGMALLLGPYAGLCLLRTIAYPKFGMTLSFVDDWYNHTVSSAMFLVGFLAAHCGPFWEQVRKLRWAALVMALAGFGLYSAIGLHFGAPSELVETGRPTLGLFYEMERWGAIVAVLGFGYRYLALGSAPPAPRYLTAVIFTYYIVHEPALMAAWHWLKPFKLNPALEAGLVAVATLAACALAYEAARRVAFIGVALGQRRFGPWSFAKRKSQPRPEPQLAAAE
ncbi:MAG: acyltransferase family protein [Caulobacteraceae bacterium]